MSEKTGWTLTKHCTLLVCRQLDDITDIHRLGWVSKNVWEWTRLVLHEVIEKTWPDVDRAHYHDKPRKWLRKRLFSEYRIRTRVLRRGVRHLIKGIRPRFASGQLVGCLPSEKGARFLVHYRGVSGDWIETLKGSRCYFDFMKGNETLTHLLTGKDWLRIGRVVVCDVALALVAYRDDEHWIVTRPVDSNAVKAVKMDVPPEHLKWTWFQKKYYLLVANEESVFAYCWNAENQALVKEDKLDNFTKALEGLREDPMIAMEGGPVKSPHEIFAVWDDNGAVVGASQFAVGTPIRIWPLTSEVDAQRERLLKSSRIEGWGTFLVGAFFFSIGMFGVFCNNVSAEWDLQALAAEIQGELALWCGNVPPADAFTFSTGAATKLIEYVDDAPWLITGLPGSIEVRNMATDGVVHLLQTRSGVTPVVDVIWPEGTPHLLSGSDCWLEVWNLETGALVYSKEFSQPIVLVTGVPNGHHALLSTGDQLHFVDIRSGLDQVLEFEGAEELVVRWRQYYWEIGARKGTEYAEWYIDPLGQVASDAWTVEPDAALLAYTFSSLTTDIQPYDSILTLLRRIEARAQDRLLPKNLLWGVSGAAVVGGVLIAAGMPLYEWWKRRQIRQAYQEPDRIPRTRDERLSV